jgi:serine/threonine protein kinase
VAIKILKASKSSSEYQTSLYSRMSDVDGPLNDIVSTPTHTNTNAKSSSRSSSSWTNVIAPIIASFNQPGPNGSHKCLVSEPMGCSVSEYIRDQPVYRSRDLGMKTHHAKGVLWHVLTALAALHSRGVIHGDLHIGNVLLPLRAPRAENREDGSKLDFFTPQDLENKMLVEKVSRRDGRPLDKHAPRYLIARESMIPYTIMEEDSASAKLIDIQGAEPERGLRMCSPISLQSPELALEGRATEAQDVWAFGCTFFEILTGLPRYLAGSDRPDGRLDAFDVGEAGTVDNGHERELEKSLALF